MYFWDFMGATEIIFIFAVYLLLFGAKGIPSLAKTMGQAVRTFRNATEDIQREILADDRPKSKDFSNVRDVTQSRPDDAHGNVGDGPMKAPSPDQEPPTSLICLSNDSIGRLSGALYVAVYSACVHPTVLHG